MRFSDLKNIFSKALPAYTVLNNGIRLYQLTGATTANSTTTSAPAGSIGITSHATGRGLIFFSDGAKWQVSTATVPVKATGAEINTGTDDAKFATAKAIADSLVFSVPGTLPVVPLTTPAVQDVIDALVTLGLVTQSD